MSKSRNSEALRHICISNNCDEIRQYLQCAPSKIATQLLTSARLVCLTFVRVLNMKLYTMYLYRPLSTGKQMEKYYEILFSYYCGNL